MANAKLLHNLCKCHCVCCQAVIYGNRCAQYIIILNRGGIFLYLYKIRNIRLSLMPKYV